MKEEDGEMKTRRKMKLFVAVAGRCCRCWCCLIGWRSLLRWRPREEFVLK